MEFIDERPGVWNSVTLFSSGVMTSLSTVNVGPSGKTLVFFTIIRGSGGRQIPLKEVQKVLEYLDEWPSNANDDASSRGSSGSRRGLRYQVEGELNGTRLEANVDTGASFNIISQDFATSRKLTPDPGSHGYIALPSGKRIFSPGKVNTILKFANEEKEHQLSCVIIPNAVHPLVLGAKFLRMTKTLTKHLHRVKKVISGVGQVSLNLVGGEQEFLSGYLNGNPTLAVPDSASDIPVISGSMAKRLGLRVRQGRKDRMIVTYIDGSQSLTDGVVRNVQWQFREDEAPVKCDFHVIDNLPVDVILNSGMIDELDIFRNYEDLFDTIGSPADQGGVYTISWDGEKRKQGSADARSLEDSSTNDRKFLGKPRFNRGEF